MCVGTKLSKVHRVRRYVLQFDTEMFDSLSSTVIQEFNTYQVLAWSFYRINNKLLHSMLRIKIVCFLSRIMFMEKWFKIQTGNYVTWNGIFFVDFWVFLNMTWTFYSKYRIQ